MGPNGIHFTTVEYSSHHIHLQCVNWISERADAQSKTLLLVLIISNYFSHIKTQKPHDIHANINIQVNRSLILSKINIKTFRTPAVSFSLLYKRIFMVNTKMSIPPDEGSSLVISSFFSFGWKILLKEKKKCNEI